jgi:non-heme chloroperoxidase
MFKNNVANFYKTEDGEQIFFLKNFDVIDSTKPMLVFNYGLVCSNHHWQFQTEYFDELGYQVLIHDYRGHFQSSGKDDLTKMTFPQMAKDVHDMCQFLGIKRAVMLGHSMGVNVCLQLAKDYPDLVHSMVLISGTFLPVKDVMFDSNVMEFVMPILLVAKGKFPRVFDKIWASASNPVIRKLVHRAGFNAQKVSEEFVDIYLNRVSQLGLPVFLQLFDEMTKQNIISNIDRMTMPSLIIGGHKDGVIPNHLQRTLATLLPHSQTYFLKDGSHVPQADFPQMVNDRIQLFITQNATK